MSKGTPVTFSFHAANGVTITALKGILLMNSDDLDAKIEASADAVAKWVEQQAYYSLERTCFPEHPLDTFDRLTALGYRLNLVTGCYERWPP